jgi:hypothetical protein
MRSGAFINMRSILKLALRLPCPVTRYSRATPLLHGLDAGTHGLAAPLVEKSAGPGGRVVRPELLEGLLAKVSPDGLQVIPKQVAQAGSSARLDKLRPLIGENFQGFNERFREEAR